MRALPDYLHDEELQKAEACLDEQEWRSSVSAGVSATTLCQWCLHGIAMQQIGDLPGGGRVVRFRLHPNRRRDEVQDV